MASLADIVRSVAADTGHTSRTVRDVLKSTFDAIGGALAGGNDVRLAGFGSFRIRVTKAGTRMAFGKQVKVKAGRKLRFTASKVLKDRL